MFYELRGIAIGQIRLTDFGAGIPIEHVGNIRRQITDAVHGAFECEKSPSQPRVVDLVASELMNNLADISSARVLKVNQNRRALCFCYTTSGDNLVYQRRSIR